MLNRSVRKLLILLTAVLFIPPVSFAADAARWSAEALETFCAAWNNHYDSNRRDIAVDYMLDDDGATVKAVTAEYRKSGSEEPFAFFPEDTTLRLICLNGYFAFCFSSEGLKGDPENVVIYSDDEVLKNVTYWADHDSDEDIWYFLLDTDEALRLYGLEHFTVRLTVDGKNTFHEVSERENAFLFELVTLVLKAQLYADPLSEKYLDSGYLPADAQTGQTAQDTPTPAPAEAPEKPYSFSTDYEGIDKAAKSVFYVEIYDENDQFYANASGFVAFDEHLFVTNQHVIDGASWLRVWDDGERHTYRIDRVIASDRKQDIALLLFPEGGSYDSLELNADGRLMRGQPIVTIGSPKGYQNAVAKGDISAFPEEDGIRYIQYTAPTSHGSSGGCLFDDSGKVIGMVTASIADGQNLNFAVPAGQIQKMYEQWDGKSWERLGSARSWDMAGTKPAPAPAEQAGDSGAKEKPEWLKIVESSAELAGTRVFYYSKKFMEENEGLFTSETGIDSSLINPAWDVLRFKNAPSIYCDKIAELRDAEAERIVTGEEYGRKYSVLYLTGSDGTVYFGCMDGDSPVREGEKIGSIYLLPLNWIRPEGSGKGSVFCAFVKYGNEVKK